MDTTNFASGQVVTGYSFPVVALYQNTGGTISYTGGRDLARGVSVNPQIETSGDDNEFYANNRACEGGQRRFRGGTLGLTVDGLFRASEDLIMGIPQSATEALTVGQNTVNMTDYNDDQNVPYCGVGCVVRSQSNGTEIFRAWVYPKTRFAQFSVPAATQEEDIDWQTTDLEARIYRDDSPKHRWQRVSEPLISELEAYNTVRVALGMETVTALPV